MEDTKNPPKAGKPEAQQESLSLELAVSGDVPSLLALGRAAAHCMARTGYVVMGADALGIVHLLDPVVIQAPHRPRVSDLDLHQMEEGSAISLMVDEGRSEDEIVAYLKRRDEVEGAHKDL